MTFHAFVERYHFYILGGALVALYVRLWFQYRRRELPRGWLNWTTLGVIYALLAVLLIGDILHPVRTAPKRLDVLGLFANRDSIWVVVMAQNPQEHSRVAELGCCRDRVRNGGRLFVSYADAWPIDRLRLRLTRKVPTDRSFKSGSATRK